MAKIFMEIHFGSISRRKKKKSIWLRKVKLFSGKIQVLPLIFAFPLMIPKPHLCFISQSFSYLMGFKGPKFLQAS